MRAGAVIVRILIILGALIYLTVVHTRRQNKTRPWGRSVPVVSSDRRPTPRTAPGSISHQRTPGTDDRRAKQEPPGLEVRPERLFIEQLYE